MNKPSRQTNRWWSAIAILALVWSAISPAVAATFGLAGNSSSSYYTVCTSQGIQLIKINDSDESTPIADFKVADCPICQSHSAAIVQSNNAIFALALVKPEQLFFSSYAFTPRPHLPWQHPLAQAPPLF